MCYDLVQRLLPVALRVDADHLGLAERGRA
jgi:hypothetical protein